MLVDLCLKEDTLDETLCYLLKKAKQRRSLLHLHCQKLRIFAGRQARHLRRRKGSWREPGMRRPGSRIMPEEPEGNGWTQSTDPLFTESRRRSRGLSWEWKRRWQECMRRCAASKNS